MTSPVLGVELCFRESRRDRLILPQRHVSLSLLSSLQGYFPPIHPLLYFDLFIYIPIHSPLFKLILSVSLFTFFKSQVQLYRLSRPFPFGMSRLISRYPPYLSPLTALEAKDSPLHQMLVCVSDANTLSASTFFFTPRFSIIHTPGYFFLFSQAFCIPNCTDSAHSS